jgi:hypothetical protein
VTDTLLNSTVLSASMTPVEVTSIADSANTTTASYQCWFYM